MSTTEHSIGRPEILQLLEGNVGFIKVWEQTEAGRGGEYPAAKIAVFETAEQLDQSPNHDGQKVFELKGLVTCLEETSSNSSE